MVQVHRWLTEDRTPRQPGVRTTPDVDVRRVFGGLQGQRTGVGGLVHGGVETREERNHGSRKISSVSTPGRPPTSRKGELAGFARSGSTRPGAIAAGHGRVIPLPLVGMPGRPGRTISGRRGRLECRRGRP